MASKQPNWQELNLGEDEASEQGTRALRFLAEQVRLAQSNTHDETNATVSVQSS